MRLAMFAQVLQVFRYAWIYVIGLFVSVPLILLFFHLNSAAEVPLP
jgi:hypothetical protein